MTLNPADYDLKPWSHPDGVCLHAALEEAPGPVPRWRCSQCGGIYSSREHADQHVQGILASLTPRDQQ